MKRIKFKSLFIIFLGFPCLICSYLYQKECWEQRNRIFTGTVVYANNSIGRYSSTCLLEVDWDGIGIQQVNAGPGTCRYKEGDRYSIAREWSFGFGKIGTAYIPEDPKLLSDSNIFVIIGNFITLVVLVSLAFIVTFGMMVI